MFGHSRLDGDQASLDHEPQYRTTKGSTTAASTPSDRTLRWRKRDRYAPFRIAAIYASFGVLWILFSDYGLAIVTGTPEQFMHLQTAKGLFYVGTTALLAWYLVKNFAVRQRHIQDELRSQRDALAESLRDKEHLVREIQHRVKNNLQVVLSITRLASQNSSDEQSANRLEKVSNRVHAISLVYEHVLTSGDFEEVDCRDYLPILINQVAGRRPRSGISIETEIPSCRLPINQAVPCGLVVNELLSNALEHAFSSGGKGTVTLTMHRENGANIETTSVLTVRDDGAGIAPDDQALGLAIAHAMAAQVSGHLSIGPRSDGRPGTEAVFRLPLRKY